MGIVLDCIAPLLFKMILELTFLHAKLDLANEVIDDSTVASERLRNMTIFALDVDIRVYLSYYSLNQLRVYFFMLLLL